MSDDIAISAHPGTLSPRDIDTKRYRVVMELPNPHMPGVGEILEHWPQGEVFAFVSGVGLGRCRNSDIAEWLSAGLIEREHGDAQMSLDFWLEASEPHTSNGSGIFVRRNGQKEEISRAEWDAQFPGCEPVVAIKEEETTELYSGNITHNLTAMADKCDLYRVFWRPGENGVRVASEAIGFIEQGLARLKADPEHFKQFNAPNGWGKYENLLAFAENTLAACREYPDAKVRVWA